jgi:hypothetical protein
VVDANILLYAVDGTAVHHETRIRPADTSPAGAEAVGPASVALLAFMRIPRTGPLLQAPMSVE